MAVDALARALAAGKVPVTAYEMAVKAGYTGTEEQFAEDMGNSGTNATNAAASASAAAASAESVSASAAQIATNTSDISDLKTQIAPEFNTSTNYKAGDYVVKDGVLYRFVYAHDAGAWKTGANVDAVAVTTGRSITDSSNLLRPDIEILNNTVFDTFKKTQKSDAVETGTAIRRTTVLIDGLSISNGQAYKVKVTDPDGIIGQNTSNKYTLQYMYCYDSKGDLTETHSGMEIGTVYTFTAVGDIAYITGRKDTLVTPPGRLVTTVEYETADHQHSVEYRLNALEQHEDDVTAIKNTLYYDDVEKSGSTVLSGVTHFSTILVVDDIYIPNGDMFSVSVDFEAGSGSAETFGMSIRANKNGPGETPSYETIINNISPGSTKELTAPVAIYGIGIYKTTPSSSNPPVITGTVTITVNYTSADFRKTVEYRLNDLDKVDDLPEYYLVNHGDGALDTDAYLQTKSSRITALASACAGNGDVFAFCTDQHWNFNEKHSPAILRYLCRNTHIPMLVLGGDTGKGIRQDCVDMFRDGFTGKIHGIAGNHDWYASDNGTFNGDGNTIAYALDIYNRDQIGNTLDHYYYVDNNRQKIRYIFLNAFAYDATNPNEVKNGYTAAQLTWFTTAALAAPAGWDYIIFTHHIGRVDARSENRDESTVDMYSFRDAIDEFNYASDSGKVIAIIQGHAHFDTVCHTLGHAGDMSDGVPIITTTCDKCVQYGDAEYWIGTYREANKGTIYEQAFDVMIVDRENHKITAVRIGCPAMDNTDKTYTSEGFDPTPTLEEREVSYAGLYPGNP